MGFTYGFYIKSFFATVVLLLFIMLAYRLLALDKGKFNSASISYSASKYRGLLIRKEVFVVEDEDSPKPQEVWLEKVFERYETIPIRKRQAGVRLCMRFRTDDSWNRKLFARFQRNGVDVGRNSLVANANAIVFVCEASSDIEFQEQGEFVFFESMKGEPIFRIQVPLEDNKSSERAVADQK